MNPDRSRPLGQTVLRASWLILPVVVGGLGHVAILKTNLFRSVALPIDGGATWHDRPLFGANKTWRGIAVMMSATALASAIRDTLARRNNWGWASAMAQSARVNSPLAGAICGLTYCLAELPNSFVKRRLGIAPGGRAQAAQRWQYLADQADSVAGCLLPLRIIYRSDARELLAAAALGVVTHIGVDQLIYALGVKSNAATA